MPPCQGKPEEQAGDGADSPGMSPVRRRGWRQGAPDQADDDAEDAVPEKDWSRAGAK